MRKVNKNVRSTAPTTSSFTTTTSPEMTASDHPTGTNAQTNLVTCKVVEFDEETGKIATDQTGRFPQRSSLGNLYVMVAYIRDANAIVAIPIKNRAEATLVSAYNIIYQGLCDRG